MGEYILSFDKELFSKYLNENNIHVDEKEARDRLQESYDNNRKNLAVKYKSAPDQFYMLYLKRLGISASEAKQLCEGPVFGEALFAITGKKSAIYLEYDFKCALDSLEHAKDRT